MSLVVICTGQQVFHLALFKVLFQFLSPILLKVLLRVSFPGCSKVVCIFPLTISPFHYHRFYVLLHLFFFYSSPSASESRGGTEETPKLKMKMKTKTMSLTTLLGEDDVEAVDTLDIVGKSLATNVFSPHNFFPRRMTSRVVKLSSVCIKQLDDMFSKSLILIPWFSNNHLIEKAHYMNLLKLLCFSSFY